MAQSYVDLNLEQVFVEPQLPSDERTTFAFAESLLVVSDTFIKMAKDVTIVGG